MQHFLCLFYFSKLNRKFVDAQLSAEGSSGSAGLGSKIAAEGSKMYRFLPNVSTTSAFASDAIAFTGTAEAGGAGSSSASSSGFSAAAAAADATADDEDEEEGYWEPASIADDPGDHSSMKSSAGVAQTVTVEEGAGCCSSGIAATAMGMAMQEKEKEKEGQEREQEERLLRGHVVDGSASASADGGTDGGAQQQEVFCLYDSDSSAEDEGAAATATATASGEQDKTSEGEGADAGADGDEVAWESASEPKSESESVEVADSDSDIVEDALVDGDEGEGGEAVDVAPVACAWPSGMRAGVLADDACAESPLSSLIGSNSNYAAPSWDSTVIDRDVLDRAMQTAASMADWAGRAVRSALRGHQHATATATTCIAVAGGSPSATSGSTMAAAGAVVGSPDPTGTARESTSAPTDIAKHSLGMSGAGTAGNLCDNEADVDLTQTGARVAAAAVAREEEQEDEEVQEEPEQDEEFRLQQEGPEEQEKREVDVRDARRRFNNAMRDTESLTEEMREEVILLLQALNLPYLIAPYEAEAQCAVLEQVYTVLLYFVFCCIVMCSVFLCNYIYCRFLYISAVLCSWGWWTAW